MKTRDNVKILLLQIRTDDMKSHEYSCFLRYSGLREDQLIGKSVFDEDVGTDMLKGYDALIIGGSGQFSVLDKNIASTNKTLKKVVRWCYKNSFPFLGACYGAHIATLALGGQVEEREKYKEIGTHTVIATKEAREDPMFSHLPEKCKVQLGHKDSIIEVPEGAVTLAYSYICPIQAYAFTEKKFYAIQFHPELDKEDFIYRINYSRQYGYVEDSEEFDALVKNTHDTPEAARLPMLFIDNVVLG